jgi:peptidoglycan/LPS O-acetylase OafA/YrhL
MSHAPAQPTEQRSRSIDLLRALAVLLVLGRHLDLCPVATSPGLHWLTGLWEGAGWMGVDLFFVLSGFLVSGLLFREHARYGRISLKNFLLRRGLKIYPGFWLLTVTTVIVLVWRGEPFKRLAVPCEFLFLQNYGPALWNHTWSLAVEEHFYFLLVLLLMLLAARRPAPDPFRVLPAVFVAIAATCLGLRLLTVWALPVFVDKLNIYPTHLRMDSLFAGVLIGYLHHVHRERLLAGAVRWRWGLLAGGIAAIAPAVVLPLKTSHFILTGGFTLLYIGNALLLLFALSARGSGGRLAACLSYVGTHSYSIYLWHMPVAAWGVPLLAGAVKAERNWFVYFAVYFLGSIGMGIVMANLIELPLLRLRDRWFPSRAR